MDSVGVIEWVGIAAGRWLGVLGVGDDRLGVVMRVL